MKGLMDASDEQFKTWPTNSDRAVFRAVMTAGGYRQSHRRVSRSPGRRRWPAPKLAEAYVFFYRAIERFLVGVSMMILATPEARSDALFETFRRYLQVVNIELEPGDDPQVIFESLNGRGVALLPSDLVRNLGVHACRFDDAGRCGHSLQQLLEAVPRGPIRQFH